MVINMKNPENARNLNEYIHSLFFGEIARSFVYERVTRCYDDTKYGKKFCAKAVALFGDFEKEDEDESHLTIYPDGFVITKYIGDATDVVIPSYIGRIPVIGVGEGVFADHKKIESVYFEEGITRIGEYAFGGCHRLHSVHLPSTLIKIDESAFCDTPLLETIDLPQGLVKVGQGAFSDSGITELILPDSLETLGDWSFMYCKKLKRVKLPSGIRHFVDYESSDGCSDDLEALFMGDDSYFYLGAVRTFDGCTSLTEVECDFEALGLCERQIKDIFGGTPWYEKRKDEIAE